MQLADNIDQIAREIGIEADDESILNIATTLCVNGDSLFTKGHPLSPSDRNVALALLTHWATATSPSRSSEEVRTLVEQTLDFGEKGRSPVKPPEPTNESKGNQVDGVAVAPRKMNPFGATGFGLGIASVFLSFIGIIPLLGIIFSLVGLFTHDEAKHDKSWQAKVGLGLNIVFMLVNMSMWGHF